MNEEPFDQTAESVEPVGLRRHNRRRTPYAGMWGPLEIIAFGVAAAAVFAVVLLYLFFVAPSASALASARADRDALERGRIAEKNVFGELRDTQSRVARLVQSVDDFETNYLPVASVGQTALYQKINALMAGYGLTNTNGPSFAPLETIDSQQPEQSEESTGRSRFRSLFPGIYATVTVEGPYQNVRRFIRDIETGNEFVVISSVEIEPSDSAAPADGQNADTSPTGEGLPPVSGGARAGKTRGNVVSLRLELAAYFRRTPAAEQAGQ